MPARFEISLSFDKVVHRIIGTSIGAAIANVIISNIDSQWAITLLALLITGILASLMKTKNYAFQVIFITVTVLLVDTFADPSTGSIDSFARLENTIIACLLSLLSALLFGLFLRHDRIGLWGA
jgi:uncharacterized membrane protein YccC